jgi:hypothetical protein
VDDRERKGEGKKGSTGFLSLELLTCAGGFSPPNCLCISLIQLLRFFASSCLVTCRCACISSEFFRPRDEIGGMEREKRETQRRTREGSEKGEKG